MGTMGNIKTARKSTESIESITPERMRQAAIDAMSSISASFGQKPSVSEDKTRKGAIVAILTGDYFLDETSERDKQRGKTMIVGDSTGDVFTFAGNFELEQVIGHVFKLLRKDDSPAAVSLQVLTEDPTSITLVQRTKTTVMKVKDITVSLHGLFERVQRYSD